MEDLFNYSEAVGQGAEFIGQSGQDIIKAMEAGLLTGMQYDGVLNTGGGLKVESLDAVLKVLENRLNQLVFLLEMPTQKIDNTVHQFNQLDKIRYGSRYLQQ